MERFLVIVAGGKGKRMGTTIPKQFLLINNRPIILHSIDRFIEFDSQINLIIALHPDYTLQWKEICDEYNFTFPYQIAISGKERFHTVKKALELVSDKKGVIAIHDAVRPMVSQETIANCFEHTIDTTCAIPVVQVENSLRKIVENGSDSVDRDQYRMVQTPQCFDLQVLVKAYDVDYDKKYTDDASVWECSGRDVMLVEGNKENIKITTQVDLNIVKTLLV